MPRIKFSKAIAKNLKQFSKGDGSKSRSKSFIIGIDEVGRGCLAGPVTVAAVLLPRGFAPKLKNLPLLRDSKKLSPKNREIWAGFIRRNLAFALAHVSPEVIDALNISKAANLAASRALAGLLKKTGAFSGAICLDGSLYLARDPGEAWKVETIVKGDEKVPAIALASIIAKTSRDRLMRRFHRKYPHYRFEENVGYGTKLHREALANFGPSEIHRRSFALK